MRLALALAVLCCLSHGAVADDATRATAAEADARSDRDRLWHLLPMAGGGVVYLVLEFGLKDAITPDRCRWCQSNWFDTGARDALKWNDVKRADFISDLTGYVAGPALATGLLIATTADERDWRLWFDDAIPVLQAGIAVGMLNQTMKVLTVRRRPYVLFDDVAVQRDGDENTAFFSGHAALAFGMATASGTVATLRGYRSATALWVGGLALASVTAYLRIASDAHYATDVIAGSVVGAGVGVAVPLLFHRGWLTRRDVVPTASSGSDHVLVGVSGRW